MHGTNNCGNGTFSAPYPIVLTTIPLSPGNITGNDDICMGDTVIYTVPGTTGAYGYDWTVPTGSTIISGAGTQSITVYFSNSAVSGNITVSAYNLCGSGPSSTLFIKVNDVPQATGPITGDTIVCQNQTSVAYSVTPAPGAINYEWQLPNGAEIIGSADSNFIVVNFSDTAISGTIAVHASNQCGDGPSEYLDVTVNVIPDAAGPITGTDTVCQDYQGITYSTSAIPEAQTYGWEVPSGVIITTGDSTTTITVDFSYTAVSGNIVVYGINTCGNGNSTSFPVVVNTVPQAPDPIIGDTMVCQNTSGLIYFVPVIPNADAYIWSLPSGATIISGDSTNSITVDFDINASSGDITVYGINECGDGLPATLSIIALTVPADAGLISGTDTVCQGEENVMFTIDSVSYAIDYVWTIPTGATIVSGDGTDTIIVNFSNSAASGNVTVYASNVCGDGVVSAPFAVYVKPLPVAPGNITGTGEVCEGATGVVYSIPEINYATGYQWTVPAGATIIGQSNTNVIVVNFALGASSGNITVYGTNDCGDGVSVSFPVTINPNPDAEITGDTDICQKDSVFLFASGGDEYLWNTGATISAIAQLVSVDTYFYVTVTNSSTGCWDAASVEVHVYINPIANAGPDKEICVESSTILNASGGITYLWIPGTGLSNDTIANPEASPATTTDYNVVVTNIYGCTDNDSVTVTVNPLPGFTLDSININCKGNDNGIAWITITDAEPPVSYVWTPTGSTNDTIYNLSAGLYTIVVTDGNGCQDFDVIIITEPAQLSVTITGDSTSCHETNDGQATALVTGGTQPYSIYWSDNNSTTTPTVTGLSPDIYYYIVIIDNNICIINDSIMIFAPSEITTGITSTSKVSCFAGADGSATVWSSGGTGSHSYIWPDPPGNTGHTANGLSAGTYLVTVADANSCSEVIPVTIGQPTEILIEYDTDSTSCFDADDGKIILDVSGGTRPYSYEWGGSTDVDSILSNLIGNTYHVTVTDNHSCTQTESITVYKNPVVCLFIPSAFSPNNDSYNDTWEIRGIQFYHDAEVQIFNRWGDKLFESKGYLQEWDGTTKNGKKLPIGPYMYIVDLKINGMEPFVGTVTIIR
ncbi:MAG: gliding motility-associated C-terminal domain-containing protein [Bacteroidia bacterium]|nr:gliding motility-associated C-terminal domain-containing protein [Bacteroidia bacterium]